MNKRIAVHLLSALICGFSSSHVLAEGNDAFSPDLKQLCTPDSLNPPTEWIISNQIPPALWASRLSCAVRDKSAVVKISVHPGDAASPNSDDKPTERVEVQIKKRVIKFDQPTWYHFRFRLNTPWQGADTREVIHQVKQDIPYAHQLPDGACHAAIPLFSIQARRTLSGPQILARVHGAENCNEGKTKTICGPWKIDIDTWNDINVILKPSLTNGNSDVRVWINGRFCREYRGILGYSDYGARDQNGYPIVNAQPRFGIYRDALPKLNQTIEFSDITFWPSPPVHDPAWSSTELDLK